MHFFSFTHTIYTCEYISPPQSKEVSTLYSHSACSTIVLLLTFAVTLQKTLSSNFACVILLHQRFPSDTG